MYYLLLICIHLFMISDTNSVPDGFTFIGTGSCWNIQNAHPTYQSLSEADNNPDTCAAACIREYGDTCAGFDTRGLCLIYQKNYDYDTIVNVRNCDGNGGLPNCDFWTDGDCYAYEGGDGGGGGPEDFFIQSVGDRNYCIETADCSDNSPITIEICDETQAGQLWDTVYFSDDQFVFQSQGCVDQTGIEYCIDVPSGNYANNQNLQLYQCHNGANQLFQYDSDYDNSGGYDDRGTLSVAGTGFCFDVPSGVYASGTPVQLYTCHTGTNQLWDDHYRDIEPVTCPNEPDSFDWDSLTTEGTNIPTISHELSISEDTLSLNIKVELEYQGYATGHEGEGPFGVTYVLDFEDYDAYNDDIYNPGTCQNRIGSDFYETDGTTLRPFDEWWEYFHDPTDGIGQLNTMAYPPPGNFWSISTSQTDECRTIVYNGTFTWNDLVGCNNGATTGAISYVTTIDGTTAITLEGVFYVNVVSPYAVNPTASAEEYYRVYQLLSQPFTISISKTVYVLGSAGINVLSISIIAVYKEKQENDFRLVILTESQNYLELTASSDTNGNYQFIPDQTDASEPGVITQGEFTWPITSDSGCLNNKNFICSQLWQIEANDLDCKTQAIDFSGYYTFTFDTSCRDTTNVYCNGDGGPDNIGWLAEHPQIAAGVELTTHLTWKDEICDPKLMEVQFDATMNFYQTEGYNGDTGTPDGEGDWLFEVGQDQIYVEIDTDFAQGTFNIFDTTLTNVWICTFAPGVEPNPIDANLGTGGCMDVARDGGCDDENDVNSCFENSINNPYFYHIWEGETQPNIAQQGFTEITDGKAAASDIIRFYFTVPHRIARDTLYVHAQVEVTLQNGQPRRILLDHKPTTNQMDHFIKRTGLTHDNNNRHRKPVYTPNNNNPQPINNYPQQPQPQLPNPNNGTFVINLSSPWVIGIGSLLVIVLGFNIIFMCFMNCNKQQRARVSFDTRRRNGYESVKNVDSEVNDSEVNAINVVSDQSD